MVSKTRTQLASRVPKSKVCKRPECRQSFTPTTAQRYCSIECRILDRKCPRCGVKIPLSQPGSKNGYCRPCGNQMARARRIDFRHKAAGVSAQRKIVFGLNSNEYEALVASQRNKCAICRKSETATRRGRVRTLCVDHDHKTGIIRGLLCTRCNTALGLFDDSRPVLSSAIAYLTNSPRKREFSPLMASTTRTPEQELNSRTNPVPRKLRAPHSVWRACSRPDCTRTFVRRTSQKYCTSECRALDKKCFSCKLSIPEHLRVDRSRLCKSCLEQGNLATLAFLQINVKTYGISAEEYLAIKVEQEGACAICKRPEVSGGPSGLKPLAIDHSHRTGIVRGLLCFPCNTALGLFKEDRKLLRSASRYLRSANTGKSCLLYTSPSPRD